MANFDPLLDAGEQDMTSYDAVIVGAGHNGLAAAVHLASKGWRVAVVERAGVAGGAVKTAEITLPGFRHDLYAMNLGLFAGSPFFQAHKDRLLQAGLEFVGATDCFASAFPDGSWLGVSQDAETNLARIAAISQSDAEAWRRMMGDFGRDAPHIFALLGAPMPSRELAGILWKAWRANGTGWLLDTGRLLASSTRAFLDARFSDERVKAMLGAWGMHLDYAPDVAGGALFPYLEAMADQAFGMALGRGGADTIIRAMTTSIEALGGEVMTGSEVVRILAEGGTARGVELADGRRLSAARAVIANTHPRILFDRLLSGPCAAAPAARKIAALRPGPATMMIHLAMSDLPDWTAGAELRRFAYVHLAPSLDVMAATYQQAMAGLLPAEPLLVVGQPTAIDASRAPAGKHILWVQVRVLTSAIRGDAAGAIAARDWDAAKDAYADRVVAIIDRYAPGTSAKVLARTVLSPLDLERDNPNLVGGDSLSGSHHLDQHFLFRPAPGWSRYRTPVDRLYMIGAATWPGGGTGAGSGFLLAKALAGKA